MAKAGQLDFPADIFRLAPLNRRGSPRRNPGGQRPAPLPPLRQRITRLAKPTRRKSGQPNDNKKTVQLPNHNEDLLPPTLPRSAPDINPLGQAGL